jgi:hypothetical protein
MSTETRNPEPVYDWVDEHGDMGRILDDGSIEIVAGADLMADGRHETMIFTEAEHRREIIAALQAVDAAVGHQEGATDAR